MHGRLKIKTTAEQAAEKQKEREEKRKLYLGGLTKAFDKRSTGTYDEEGLKVTAQLLMANPDAATLWNFRREIILAMKSDDHESWDKLLQGELLVVENCLMKNHKSYGAWHHRCWVMENFPNPPWDKELALCDKYLKADERNFHCWDYRRFVVARSSKQPEDELKTSQLLIERNLSNYSAWHYRSKLLPLVYPPLPDTPHPVSENTLIKELQTVVEAVFTDPSDQSPWFFLRWLVNRQEKNPRLLQTGFISSGTKENLIVCVFSKPLMQQNVPQISVDDEDVGNNEWYAPDNETYSYVWVVQLKELSEGEHSIAISFNSCSKKSLTVSPGATSVVWMTELEEDLTGLTRSTLEEVKQNCITLDELDPGNKWVLLTIVDVMWALDSYSHQEKISSYLSQLQDLDPLRTKYYADMKSKLSMETALKKHRLTTENDAQFRLNGRSLTRIAFSHLLACSKSVDLSCNELSSIQPLKSLVACKELLLDDNQIVDITPLAFLKRLEKLSLSKNKIDSLDQLKPLQGIVTLKELTLSSNNICNIENIDEQVKEFLPQVQRVIW
ncbi:geranylgeranyl transferase type-2 subunit alpha-like [Penaeus monodon]|uniref:geranylgeranyl transferase type-2 subunit alpha-like n=1 Tax=Penaeus monodon TaxID=6687 RepID=UPI0018A753A2|nr:geranylgeranyl transferase type-2 subunit alpha-like [Penaeus monodon]